MIFLFVQDPYAFKSANNQLGQHVSSISSKSMHSCVYLQWATYSVCRPIDGRPQVTRQTFVEFEWQTLDKAFEIRGPWGVALLEPWSSWPTPWPSLNIPPYSTKYLLEFTRLLLEAFENQSQIDRQVEYEFDSDFEILGTRLLTSALQVAHPIISTLYDVLRDGRGMCRSVPTILISNSTWSVLSAFLVGIRCSSRVVKWTEVVTEENW